MSRPRVLYVDDERINLLSFQYTYDDELDVVAAGSAEEAMAALQSNTVDLVLTDQRMPDRSGVELCRQAREAGHVMPCVIVTGYIDDEEVNAALSTDLIQDILHKPIVADKILQLIKRHLPGGG